MDIIRKIDYDGSGTLEFEEFISVMEKVNMESEIEEDEVFLAFKQFDKKNTGVLSVIEFKSIIQEIARDVNEDEIFEFLNEANLKIGDVIKYKEFLIKWREELDF